MGASMLGATARMWDELWLGGALVPGVATVSGKGIERKIDTKNPKGASGASIKDEGDELTEFDIAIMQWSDAQRDAFVADFLPFITPRRKGGPKTPIETYHPVLELVGVTRIYVKGIPIPEHDKRKGTITWTLKCIEWVPAPVPQKKAAGSKGSNKNDDDLGDGVGYRQTEVESIGEQVGEKLNVLKNMFK